MKKTINDTQHIITKEWLETKVIKLKQKETDSKISNSKQSQICPVANLSNNQLKFINS